MKVTKVIGVGKINIEEVRDGQFFQSDECDTEDVFVKVDKEIYNLTNLTETIDIDEFMGDSITLVIIRSIVIEEI